MTLGESRHPDFLIVGAQRSGTSWLHRRLGRHRDIWLLPSPLKEVHYFNELHVPHHKAYRHGRWAKFDRFIARVSDKEPVDQELLGFLHEMKERELSDDWYRDLFRLAPAGKIIGEATPAYSMLPEAGIAHVLRVNPDMRFILSLRHPIDRAWSQVRFLIGRADRAEIALSGPEPSLDELRALAFSDRNLMRTDYAAIVGRYRSVVPDGQLRVQFFDDVRSRPLELLQDAAAFVGADPGRFNEAKLALDKRSNVSNDIVMPAELGAELAERHRDTVRWVLDNVDGAPTDWMDRIHDHIDRCETDGAA